MTDRFLRPPIHASNMIIYNILTTLFLSTFKCSCTGYLFRTIMFLAPLERIEKVTPFHLSFCVWFSYFCNHLVGCLSRRNHNSLSLMLSNIGTLQVSFFAFNVSTDRFLQYAEDTHFANIFMSLFTMSFWTNEELSFPTSHGIENVNEKKKIRNPKRGQNM